MSTILKALRRLEQEKAATEVPRPLREQIASTPYSGRKQNRGGWPAAVIALVLGVGAGAGAIWWMFGGAGTGTDVLVVAAPEARAPVASVALPSAEPLERSAPEPEPGPPDHAFESDVEIVERPEALPRLADADPVALSQALPQPGSRRPVESSTAAARAREAAIAEMAQAERARLRSRRDVAIAAQAESPAAEATPSPPAPIVAARAEAPPPAPVAPAREPIVSKPAPALVAPNPVAPKRAPAPVAPKPAPEVATARPAPLPAEPSQSAARTSAEPPPPEAPALEVEKTQWHPLADRRIAWLRVAGESEPLRVVEGDVVDGMLVAKIEPSGVVFERDGEQLHRTLGKLGRAD